MAEKSNKIELWEGYEVEFSDALLKDADFIKDFDEAAANNRSSELAMLVIALVAGKGGENASKIYDDIRDHVIAEKGYFDVDELGKILVKITDKLPKAGNRAQRRSWKTLN